MKTDQEASVSVAVLIPVKDDLSGLLATLASIDQDRSCRATILILDDGSKVPVEVIASNYFHRIELHRFEANLGISKALNKLIELAEEGSFDFAARIDAGDIWIQGRFQIQISYMLQHPDVVLLGGASIITNSKLEETDRFNPPVATREIGRAFRLGYPISHPTVMLRLANQLPFPLRYPVSLRYAEDYALFLRIFNQCPSAVANQPDYLIYYVRASQSVGVAKQRSQALSALRTRLSNFKFRDPFCYLGVLDPKLIGRIVWPSAYTAISQRIKILGKKIN